MMTYNWCHNPDCHTYHTTDRIRGVKGKKVLRTRKIKINNWNKDIIWSYFCNNNCLFTFLKQFRNQVVAIAPVHQASETPIHDPIRQTHTTEYSWGNHSWTTTEIKPIENN